MLRGIGQEEDGKGGCAEATNTVKENRSFVAGGKENSGVSVLITVGKKLFHGSLALVAEVARS